MRHRIFIPAATALLFALAACTQDELAGDNRLPEGEYPVVIRATGLSVEATPLAAPSTRASVDGDWQGVTSVALKMGDAVKEYTVTASTDFKSATLSRENAVCQIHGQFSGLCPVVCGGNTVGRVERTGE